MADETTTNTTPEQPENPSLIGAAWRLTTVPGSLLARRETNAAAESRVRRGARLGDALDAGPIEAPRLTTDQLIERMDRDQMWPYEENFVSVQNELDYERIKGSILRERQDREVMDDAGLLANLGAGLLTGLADPFNYITIGRAANMIRTGSTATNVAIQTGLTAGVSQAAKEPFLQATQELRTAEEGAVEIAASVVLGSVLGGGASALINSPGAAALGRGVSNLAIRARDDVAMWMRGPDWNEQYLTQALDVYNGIQEDIMRRSRPPTQELRRLQTEAFDAVMWAERRMELHEANSMAPAGPMEYLRSASARMMGSLHWTMKDPHDFIFKRAATVEGKLGLQKIMEVTTFLNKNADDFAPTAQAATTEKDIYVGRWAEFRDSLFGGSLTSTGAKYMGRGNSLYAQALRSGFQGGTGDFEGAIYRAVINGHVDPNGNPVVTQAARQVRDITEEMRELANRAGYNLPTDTPRYALGYAPRVYNVPEVVGADQGRTFRRAAERAYYNEMVTDLLTTNPNPTPQQMGALRRRSRTLAQQAYDRITRSDPTEGGISFRSVRENNMGSALRERVLPLSDEFLIQQGWIQTSISDVLNHHIRHTVPELLLANRFKTATGLPDPSLENSLIPAIQREYLALANGALRGTSPNEPLRGRGLTGATTNPEREAILREGEEVVSLIRSIRDGFLDGTRISSGLNMTERVEKMVGYLKVYQAMRLMGNLLFASLPDLGGLVVRNGVGRTLTTIANDFTAAKMTSGVTGHGWTPDLIAREAKRWGAATEWASNAQSALYADNISPFASSQQTGARFLHNMNRAYSISTLATHWNDIWKTKVYRATMDRILEAGEQGFDNIPDYDKRWMAYLGLGRSEVNRIAAAWRGQNAPLHDTFLRFGALSEWQDQEAARLVANALNKDVASTIIRPRLGDKSRLSENPVVQVILQFQNFAFSSALRTLTLAEQRLRADGLASVEAARIAAGFTMMASLGMTSTYMYAWLKDQAASDEKKDNVRKLEENPGMWIANGIERSGITGMFGYYNSLWERMGGTGANKSFSAAMGDPSQQNDMRGRWLTREPLQILAGPTLSQANDLIKLQGMVWNPGTKKDVQTYREALPWQNHFVVRQLLDRWQEDIAKDLPSR